MRTAVIVFAAAWLMQSASAGPQDESVHLRYERAVQLPADAAGEACAVLDAQVFEHMASRSREDLRVHRETSGSAVEVPFTLVESEAEASEAQTAAIENVTVHGDTLGFNLRMPSRPYTAVELNLAASDFVAVATVTGSDGRGGPWLPLGEYTLFDLTREHLARSTELALQESRLPLLHVELRVHGMRPTAEMVRGATVPPSREAQTLYTPVATPASVKQANGNTLIVFKLPEHVPVERLRFVLAPGPPAEFLRSVWMQTNNDVSQPETVEGEIWSVHRAAGEDGAPAIHAEKLSVDSVLAANVRSRAEVHVAVKNIAKMPLPFSAVVLEMRQRSLCFQVEKGSHYSLRYGDAGLHAPVYQQVSTDDPQAVTHAHEARIEATLGPELRNPAYAARLLPWQPDRGQPELYWIGLVAVLTLLGTLGLHRARQGRKKT